MVTLTTIFGWFQTHLNVSLESSNCLGAAKLQHNEKVIVTFLPQFFQVSRVNFLMEKSMLDFWNLSLELNQGFIGPVFKMGTRFVNQL
jgi:hypothetical protein